MLNNLPTDLIQLIASLNHEIALLLRATNKHCRKASSDNKLWHGLFSTAFLFENYREDSNYFLRFMDLSHNLPESLLDAKTEDQVIVLLSRGADINAIYTIEIDGKNTEVTALSNSLIKRKYSVMKTLINYGALITFTTSTGKKLSSWNHTPYIPDDDEEVTVYSDQDAQYIKLLLISTNDEIHNHMWLEAANELYRFGAQAGYDCTSLIMDITNGKRLDTSKQNNLSKTYSRFLLNSVIDKNDIKTLNILVNHLGFPMIDDSGFISDNYGSYQLEPETVLWLLDNGYQLLPSTIATDSDKFHEGGAFKRCIITNNTEVITLVLNRVVASYGRKKIWLDIAFSHLISWKYTLANTIRHLFTLGASLPDIGNKYIYSEIIEKVIENDKVATLKFLIKEGLDLSNDSTSPTTYAKSPKMLKYLASRGFQILKRYRTGFEEEIDAVTYFLERCNHIKEMKEYLVEIGIADQSILNESFRVTRNIWDMYE